jgi:hypothetical protein
MLKYVVRESYDASHGNKVVVCTAAQLAEYFNKIEVVDG